MNNYKTWNDRRIEELQEATHQNKLKMASTAMFLVLVFGILASF